MPTTKHVVDGVIIEKSDLRGADVRGILAIWFLVFGIRRYTIFMSDDTQVLIEKARPIFEKYGLKKVGIFGSRARGDNRSDSDLDLLFERGEHAIGLFEKQRIEEELELALGVAVDLVSAGGVAARLRPYIKKDIRVIYERR